MPPRQHKLISIDWPDFGGPEAEPRFSVADLQRRIDATRNAMERCGLSHLVVYADREHCANLLWLTGFDPRFEEALLILGARAAPLLLTGIECRGYLAVSPLAGAGKIRHEVFDAFSLPDIPPSGGSRPLAEILLAEGIGPKSRVGCTGWKTYAGDSGASDLPAYVLGALQRAADSVTNATGLFIDCADGLRTSATAAEIAWFEYSNVLASEGMKRALHAIEIGATDYQLVQAAQFNGFPQGCHWGMKTGPNAISLASPRGAHVEKGQPLSGNVCYRGSNCCRAGWVAEAPGDLPESAQDYVQAFAGPYFAAMSYWFEALRIGNTGGDLHRAIHTRLSASHFGIQLNAGHLIHFEEWLGSPVSAGSAIPLRSGMLFQSDVIPRSKAYYSTRLEDTYALADAGLQREVRERFPDCFARCLARRDFLRNVLGIPLPDDVLPLSNLAGIAPPYLLRPELVLALEQ